MGRPAYVIVQLDAEGAVVGWNRTATQLLGVEQQDIVGRPLASLLRLVETTLGHAAAAQMPAALEPEPAAGGRGLWETLRAEGRCLAAVPLPHGQPLLCEVALALAPPFDEEGLAVIIRDVSAERRREQEWLAALGAAQTKNNAKDDFVATMSHEMRTPLNAILGMTELLGDTPLNAEQQDYLRTLSDSGEMLLSLVNDLLDLSKIEAGELPLEEKVFNPRDVIRNVLRIVRARARARGLELTETIGERVPDDVVGDAGRVRQVLLNLVNNAVKFTERGSVRLSLQAQASRKEAQLLFAVTDTGMGIPEESQAGIFDRFYQVDAAGSKRFDGSGLGLRICKLLAERMGGRVWLERSRVGHGSEFRFEVTLSRNRTKPRRTRPRMVQIERRAPARILLAEDDAQNRRIICRLLESAGNCVMLAKDGIEAVKQYKPHWFDVLLFDVDMPRCDGVSATRQIRKIERAGELPRMPILALTAHATEQVRRRCMDAGMDDFLMKPATRVELLRAIDQHLKATPAALVADDSRASREVMMRFIMKQSDLRVCWADNGRRVVDLADRAHFSLIFLDVEMPLLDGPEAAAALRKRGCSAYMVAVSGHNSEEVRRRCFDAGCDAYMTKPISSAALNEILALAKT